MAFCKYCGQPVADQAAFCGACGKSLAQTPAQPVAAPAQPVAAPAQPVVAPAQPVAAPAQPVAAPAQPVAAPAQPVAAPAQKKPNWVLLGGIAAAVVAVVVVLILLLGGGSSPEKAFENMWAATYEGDTSVVHDLMPDSCWTYVAQRYGVSEQMLTMAMSQEYSQQLVQMTGVEFSYDILNTVEANEMDLASLRQEVAEEFECISPMSITAACALNVQMNMGVSFETETMTAVEIDGNWYLLDGIEMLMEMAEDFM